MATMAQTPACQPCLLSNQLRAMIRQFGQPDTPLSMSLGQQLDQTISHTIDDELHRLVPLEPAPQERPR